MELWMKLMLLAGMMAGVFTATAIPVSATWWDTSYGSCKTLTINLSSGSLNNMTTTINITYDASMKTDFSDIRITNGTDCSYSTDPQGLIGQYLINKTDSQFANFEILLPTVNRTVSIYFNKPTATLYSNRRDSNLLWDDYSEAAINTTLWYANMTNGAAAIDSSTMSLASDSTNDGGVRYCTNSLFPTPLAVEFDWATQLTTDPVRASELYALFARSSQAWYLTVVAIYTNGGWKATVYNSNITADSTYSAGVWYHEMITATSTLVNVFTNVTGTMVTKSSLAPDLDSPSPICPQAFHPGGWSQGHVHYDNFRAYTYTAGTVTYSFGAKQNLAAIQNISLAITVFPATIYKSTNANFSILYNESNNRPANITLNVTVDNINISTSNPTVTLVNVPANTTVYFYLTAGNYSKHQNITINATVTTNIGENASSVLTTEVNNSIPSTPSITFSPDSVIVGDVLVTNSTSTDADSDTLTYWFRFGYTNGTNITAWQTLQNFTVNTSYENDTIRVYSYSNDGEVNSTFSSSSMIVTHMNIVAPTNNQEITGNTPTFTLNITNQVSQNCTETLGTSIGGNQSIYYLGLIATSLQNHSRYVWYGNNTYNATCYSKQDPTRVYYKLVNFTNIFANWSVSIYTENDWDVPLAIAGANLSIFVNCEGGSQYVYNFTGSTITNVKPLCDVQSITAKVDYPSDSYARERSVPSCTSCDIRLYMVDALLYTVLQIPIYMSDYNYFDSKVELYKLSGSNHYTIAEGFFDVEHKYVTYLAKDNTYYIRITKGSEVRDIGYLYAATATAQYLSLSSIRLVPSITLISDNLLMSAAFDNVSAPLSVLRIQYEDLMNMTQDIRVQVFNDTSNTAWYDNTFTGISNLSIALNGINTSVRYSVHWTVHHAVLGNSPIEFTAGVGAFGRAVDLGLPANLVWIYPVVAFVLMLFTMFIIVPEIRLVGYLMLMMELGVFTYFAWFHFPLATVALFITFLAAGILYEMKYKGTT